MKPIMKRTSYILQQRRRHGFSNNILCHNVASKITSDDQSITPQYKDNDSDDDHDDVDNHDHHHHDQQQQNSSDIDEILNKLMSYVNNLQIARRNTKDNIKPVRSLAYYLSTTKLILRNNNEDLVKSNQQQHETSSTRKKIIGTKRSSEAFDKEIAPSNFRIQGVDCGGAGQPQQHANMFG